MVSVWPRLTLLVGVVCLAGCQQVSTRSTVAVRALAWAPAAAPAVAPQPATKTYVFVKGRNISSERELDRVPFDVIAKPLAADLKASGLEPAAGTTSPDILIVVNWGITTAASQPGQTMAYDLDEIRRVDEAAETARADARAAVQSGNVGEMVRARGEVAAAEANLRSELLAAQTALSWDRAPSETVDMLGIRDLLAKSEYTPDIDILQGMLEEERYFIGLVAYDAQALQQRKKRVVWTTRMSMPVRGVTFADAVARMSAAAASLYGTQQSNMVFKPAGPRTEPVPEVQYSAVGAEK